MKSEQISESLIGDYYGKLLGQKEAVLPKNIVGDSEKEITFCEMVEKLFKGYYKRTLPVEIEAAITEHFGGCDKCREGFDKWLSKL
jgi:hypothetical protein